jgi:dephospho-CoA kinase
VIIQPQKLLVGLTGGIACGKSTALNVFGELGWETISSDAIVADLLDKNEVVKQSIKTNLGPSLLVNDEVDKKKVAEVIFNNSEAKTWLENLLHPLVRETWQRLVAISDKEHVVVEIPLLFEKNLKDLFQITVCVQCEKKTQLRRLFDRGLTKAQSNARIKSQMSLNEKIHLADIVLLGDHSLLFLKQQIEHFHANNT